MSRFQAESDIGRVQEFFLALRAVNPDAGGGERAFGDVFEEIAMRAGYPDALWPVLEYKWLPASRTVYSYGAFRYLFVRQVF
jgi:hypothetical protein